MESLLSKKEGQGRNLGGNNKFSLKITTPSVIIIIHGRFGNLTLLTFNVFFMTELTKKRYKTINNNHYM